MIVSHKYKYILVKPGKVAGTAIEISLQKSCGDLDIITPISIFDPSCDQDSYKYYPQNNLGFCEHMALGEIKKKHTDIFDDYLKISIIRNPWDMIVSRWHWETWMYSNFGKPNLKSYINMFKKLHRNQTYTIEQLNRKLNINLTRSKISDDIKRNNFKGFVTNFPAVWTNDQYYFLYDEMVLDFVIRYETLQNDYEKLCSNIGIQSDNLLNVKSKLRPPNSHYSNYYDSESKTVVEEKFKKQIEVFGYKFDSE